MIDNPTLLKLLEYGLGTAITLGVIAPLLFVLVRALINDRKVVLQTINNHFEHMAADQQANILVQKEIAAHMAVSNELLRELKNEHRSG